MGWIIFLIKTKDKIAYIMKDDHMQLPALKIIMGLLRCLKYKKEDLFSLYIASVESAFCATIIVKGVKAFITVSSQIASY